MTSRGIDAKQLTWTCWCQQGNVILSSLKRVCEQNAVCDWPPAKTTDATQSVKPTCVDMVTTTCREKRAENGVALHHGGPRETLHMARGLEATKKCAKPRLLLRRDGHDQHTLGIDISCVVKSRRSIWQQGHLASMPSSTHTTGLLAMPTANRALRRGGITEKPLGLCKAEKFARTSSYLKGGTGFTQTRETLSNSDQVCGLGQAVGRLATPT